MNCAYPNQFLIEIGQLFFKPKPSYALSSPIP
jgi:hypothetical protein